MQPYHMKVDLCPGGVEAIEAMKTRRYDLVFMDHMMPEMDGMETVGRIREMADKDAYYSTVPIIALTANAVTGTKEMFMENGFDDFLSKPIETAKLRVILGEWVPKEKQIIAHESAPPIPQQETDIGFVIPGVDVKKGVSLTGGTMDGYVRALTIYRHDGLTQLTEIKKSLDDKDLRLFTTHTHAIKGASATIGADKLAAAAEALEMAGLRKDESFIDAHVRKFLEDYNDMLSRIKEALPGENKNAVTAAPVDTAALKSALMTMKKALDDYDSPAINETAKTLQGFVRDPGAGETINTILQHKVAGEYEEAILLIDTLLGGDTQ